MSRIINQNLKCEIDSNIDDRRREPPHCHITKRGYRVASVSLEPSVSIGWNNDLDHNERNLVYEYCCEHQRELISEYKDGR